MRNLVMISYRNNISRVTFWKDIQCESHNRSLLSHSENKQEIRQRNAKEKRHRLFLQKITKLEVSKRQKEVHKKLKKLIFRREIVAKTMAKQMYLQQIMYRV